MIEFSLKEAKERRSAHTQNVEVRDDALSLNNNSIQETNNCSSQRAKRGYSPCVDLGCRLVSFIRFLFRILPLP